MNIFKRALNSAHELIHNIFGRGIYVPLFLEKEPIKIEKAVFMDKDGNCVLVGFNDAEKKLFEDDFETFSDLYMTTRGYINFNK